MFLMRTKKIGRPEPPYFICENRNDYSTIRFLVLMPLLVAILTM